MTFKTEPHEIATLADREVWLADFEDTEGNTLALMSEPRIFERASILVQVRRIRLQPRLVPPEGGPYNREVIEKYDLTRPMRPGPLAVGSPSQSGGVSHTNARIAITQRS